jgi:hypothetical protein
MTAKVHRLHDMDKTNKGIVANAVVAKKVNVWDVHVN